MENNTVLFDNTIDIVMENCESISVDAAVIESLRMETDNEEYVWDNMRNRFMKTTTLKYFRIVIDIGKIENSEFPVVYITRYVNQAKRDKFEEQKEAMEILKKSDYISSVYINGEHFRVPWKPDPEHPYSNEWETHSEKYGDSGKHVLTITIVKNEQ
jgi:hypothetical protein